MRMLAATWVALFAAVLLATASWAGGVRQAEDIFRGVWVVDSAELKSKPVNTAVGDTLRFDGTVVTITTKSGEVKKGLFKADHTTKPQSFDLIMTEGGKEKYYGVYDFAGGRLRLIYATRQAERPTQLRTEANQNWTLLNLARVRE